MKKLFYVLVLLALVFQAASGSLPPTSAQEIQPLASESSQATPVNEEGGMPGWPVPDKPIPHHEPGQPARSGSATYQTSRLNELGEPEVVELTGLDALLADGTISDPFQGNYSLVNLDKVMFSYYSRDNDILPIQSFEFVTPTLELIPDSTVDYGDKRFSAIAAGDLNGDLVDEQIVAWLDPADNHIKMIIGESPGSMGKTTSAPAAIAHPDGTLDVVVRGYDQALWHSQFDGAAWGNWDNNAGGLLISSPAVASRAAGELDVFAVGVDNQVWQSHLGAVWSGFEKVDCGVDFPAIERVLPPPYVPGPGVAARSGNQLDLFRRGADNTLRWCHSNDGAAWGTWEDLGGMLASGPAAVALGDGRLQVYALGMDGALWYRTYDSGWGTWLRLGTPAGVALNAVPVLISPATGQVAVYLAGTEGHIWTNTFNGSSWGSWTSSDVGGQLGLGIGAAVGPSGTHLFAQMGDGSMMDRLNASSWTNLDWLGSQATDTGATTRPFAEDVNNPENSYFDITTGYFSGDGRQQIVVAYDGADDYLKLEIYDIQDGFKLVKIAELDPGQAKIPGYHPRVATGDIDGNGVDEIGLAYAQTNQLLFLRIFQIDEFDPLITLNEIFSGQFGGEFQAFILEERSRLRRGMSNRRAGDPMMSLLWSTIWQQIM